MKRLLIAFGATTVLLVSSANAGTAPKVSFAKLAPTVVTGSGFAADRPVRVKVSCQGGNLVKVVRAGTSGRFTARCASSVVVFQFRGLLVTATQAGGEPVSREAGRRKDLWRDRRSARLTGLRRLVDVTTGDNSVAADPTTPGTPITGFSATASFDEVTGWGSPIAGALLPAIAKPGNG